MAAVEEERQKNEHKLNDVIEQSNKTHQAQMEESMRQAEKNYQDKLQEALKTEQEASALAIRQSCEEERKKTNELLNELKVWLVRWILNEQCMNLLLFDRLHKRMD